MCAIFAGFARSLTKFPPFFWRFLGLRDMIIIKVAPPEKREYVHGMSKNFRRCMFHVSG
jgi:hypothetical protein